MALKTRLCITKLGLKEIKEQSKTLSMLERRLLILSNGKRDINELSSMMKRADVPELSLKLQIAGFLTEINLGGRPAPKPRKEAPSEAESDKAMEEVAQASSTDASAQEQMLKALEILSTPQDCQAIRNKISAAETNEELKELMEEWYEVINHSKSNSARADAFRKQVDTTIVSSYMILF